MNDREKQHQVQEIQRQLNDKGLSRRSFLDCSKVLGFGFGAGVMLGVRDADADIRSDASINLKSTNPALNNIIEEGRQDRLLNDQAVRAESHDPNIQMANSRSQQPQAPVNAPTNGQGYGLTPGMANSPSRHFHSKYPQVPVDAPSGRDSEVIMQGLGRAIYRAIYHGRAW